MNSGGNVLGPPEGSSGVAGFHGRCQEAPKPSATRWVASPYGLRAICLDTPPVHVDHRHKTGRVRGVLSFNCNSAIGTSRDKSAAARRTAAYLEGNLWKPTLVAPGVCRLPS
ncbi:endonuclease domain-containing protein [Streptomyces sp. NPDC051016]|uniref:endonuclease domain-containing protein n=1 Tax=Streptomyces sp. NPDC051016 TaxID=3365638 RepID=UPI0037B0B49E